MAQIQMYGIKYPFENQNIDNIFMDLNESNSDAIKSKILHIIFTPKGQRLRMPSFGTNLIKYIFDPSTNETLENIKIEITNTIREWIPNVEFEDIVINDDETNEYGKVIIIHYNIVKGKIKEKNSVGVRI